MENKNLKRKIASLTTAALMLAGFGVANVNTFGTMYLNNNMMNVSAASSVSITESAGYAEGAYVCWSPVDGAEGYNVYCDGVQLDSMLIRQYSGYFRADAVGITAGSHTIKVVPVIGGKADSSKSAETSVNSEAHDRSGFGFVNGTSSGAYNEDGTLKSDALVVYVTNDNKDTVTAKLNVEGKGEVDCVGLQNIVLGYKKGKETRPMAIRIIGNITDPAVLTKGDFYLDTVKAGMTIEGIGKDATFNGFGLVMKNCSNIEVRNIGFMNCDSSEGDDCGLQQKNDHVWVHNCDFYYGDAGSDADQVKGDGALDTKTSSYITHSYNHFYDNGKCNLQGMKSESTENYITYHHNWYDHSDSRHPRIRTCTVHIYNNYYDGNAKYGAGVTMGASAFVENNYFRNCKYPMLASMQGSDIASGDGGTFSGEDGGIIKAYGNVMEGQKAFVSYQENSTEFDAYVASSKDEKVPDSVKTKQGGTSYNNFDTSSIMYSYNADSAEDVKSIVTSKAGRVNGGDLQWTFDNSVDDTSYAVNDALKAAVTSYDDSIVAIGSGFKDDSGSTTPAQTTAPSDKPQPPVTTVTTKNPGSTVTPSGDVKVLSSGGWNEMAYMNVSGIKAADVKSVSYSGASTGSLSANDMKYLVRNTDSGVRVDILGLKAGSYTITLDTSKGKVSQSSITVNQQDRSGYAHYNYSEGVGAYNDDGTLKANALVLYVTEENKNTVSVTSKDGTTVTGIGNILNSVGQDVGTGATANGGKPNTNQGIIKKLAEDGTPLVVRIVGNVTAPEGVTVFDSTDLGGSVGDNGYMARMKSGKNITIEGVGADATVNGWGFHFMAESSAPEFGKSFEVRNIAFRNVPEDCIGMEGVQEGSALTASVERCWIHNCEFYVPKIANPAESDKAEGDGACDFKRGQYFTNSYCYYEGYHKTNLVGASDSNMQYHLTYHHNYWKNCESRGPLARQANIHMYNNVFDGQTSYCMNPRANAYIFSEYNVFKDSKNPMQIKSGAIKSYNDVFSNVKGDQDGTIVTDKNTKVDSANKYANFDTDSSLCYIPSGNYDLDTASSDTLFASLSSIFESEGGCMDETSISQGDPITTTVTTSSGGSGETTTTTKKPVTPAPSGGYTHNFTENDKNSSFYTITGNLSSSKGTVSYGGMTLTKCLKMESSTNVSFNASNDGTLTLVFVEPSATVKVDGTKYTASNGVLTVDLKSGSHSITKADSANLFYINYSESGSTPSSMKGDVTNNGVVDIADVVSMAAYVGDPETNILENDAIIRGDVHNAGDGLTGSDVLMVQQYIAKIITEF